MSLSIRPVTDSLGCEHVQEVIRIAWGNLEPLQNLPVHILSAMPKHGGVLLGAYADDGPAETGGIVGMAMGWLGAEQERADPPGSLPKLKLHSHLLGVLPQWRRQHIGIRLKLAQREAVLAQGLTDWMTWTFDPLLQRNARLNIHRLGATARVYMRDVFGEYSDRFQVDWRLRSPDILQNFDSPRPEKSWDPSGLNAMPVTTGANNLEKPVDQPLSLDGRPLALPVPADIAAIWSADAGLVTEWRHYHRATLEPAFAAGYTLVDCVQLPPTGYHYYILESPSQVH